MIRKQLQPNFTDDRGAIMDIFVNRPFEHCVTVSSKKGSVRGNHYHKLSSQCDFMVSGRMAVFSRKEGSEEIEQTIVGPHDWVEWDKSEVHEFIALDDDVVFVTFVNGPRGGDNYESDTYRLPVPLHELKGVSLEDILKG
jgi:dTDP-4-dehydrorhamnose 3,5-epimerase-like enzyme